MYLKISQIEEKLQRLLLRPLARTPLYLYAREGEKREERSRSTRNRKIRDKEAWKGAEWRGHGK